MVFILNLISNKVSPVQDNLHQPPANRRFTLNLKDKS
jgi:hypothetical protein